MVSLVENKRLSDSSSLYRSPQSCDLSVFCFHFAAARHLAKLVHAITQNAKFFETNGQIARAVRGENGQRLMREKHAVGQGAIAFGNLNKQVDLLLGVDGFVHAGKVAAKFFVKIEHVLVLLSLVIAKCNVQNRVVVIKPALILEQGLKNIAVRGSSAKSSRF